GSKNFPRIRQGSVKRAVAGSCHRTSRRLQRGDTALTPHVVARPPLRPYCTNDRPYFGPGSHVEALHAKSHLYAVPPVVTADVEAPPAPQEVQIIGADEARVLAVAALADAGMCAADAQQVAD